MISRMWDRFTDWAFENRWGVKPEHATTLEPEFQELIGQYVPEYQRRFRDTENPVLRVIRVHDD